MVESEGVGHRFRVASEAAHNIMAGYHNNPDAGGMRVATKAGFCYDCANVGGAAWWATTTTQAQVGVRPCS